MNKIEEDTFVKCPYDSNHVMKSFKLAAHIVKCMKRHPEMNLKVCPYNWNHRFTDEEMTKHLEHCESKKFVSTSPVEVQAPIQKKPAPKEAPPSTKTEELRSFPTQRAEPGPSGATKEEKKK